MTPKKFKFQIFSFILSLMMSGIMSFVMLTIELQQLNLIMSKWPEAWFVSLLVAFPVSLMIVPLTERLISPLMAK